MRLIGRVDSKHQGKVISSRLTQAGIENHYEIAINQDWGNDAYGTESYNIWITEEDQLEQAQQIFDTFIQEPSHEQHKLDPRASEEKLKAPPLLTVPSFSREPRALPKRFTSFGLLTLYLLFICGWLFIWSEVTTPSIPSRIPDTNLPLMPLFSPPIKKQLMYDYPYAFVIVDKLVALYGLDKALDPTELPPEGEYLIKEYTQTPYWQGVYDMVVAYLRGSEVPWNFTVPMFEKIQRGEVWRLFTPCLLHNDILHIFFNMFWLIILGNQLESRLGRGRYLLFIFITACLSNTAQYLMTGANFMGFSGVLCAMCAFIWMRQRKTPWEGYQLDRMTLGFVFLFIGGMALLQMFSFYMAVYTDQSIMIGVANTAHLTGAVLGALLGVGNLFAWKS